MALSTRTKYVSGFVSLIGKDRAFALSCIDKFRSWGEVECESFACIVHDLDTEVDEKSGEVRLKTLHFHFVCVLAKDIRISTFINRVSSACGVLSVAVTADKTTSVEGALQYLIHKNDPDKHQYEVSDIVRKWDDSDFNVLMEAKPSQVSFDYFYNVCVNAHTIVDVIREVGLSKYHAYRNTIQDIFKCVH